MIQKIITPIDGSKHAQMALKLSADLAAMFDAQLLLLHVGSADEAGPELLQNALERAKKFGVRQVETGLEAGDPADRILARALDEAADLIVMGSRGVGALDGLVMGSVSHKVFHLAPCSCITVNLEAEAPELEGVKTILVPTDGSREADRAVELASEVAGKYGADIVLFYSMWRGPSLEQLRSTVDVKQLSKSTWAELDPKRHPIAEHTSNALIAPVVPQDALKEIGEQVLERGRQTALAKGVENPKVILHDGEPARSIISTARREKADLIAMGSRGLGGVAELLGGSVSYKVSHSAPCSCMIVR
ncbi:MAG: universal stress protein [Alphaproteobacteria bacterium]|nr:universal stress protein [Alphaproteobacteria bacterium]